MSGLDPSAPPARRALVAGRFDPPHEGHLFVLDAARAVAGDLHVLVEEGAAAVPAELRVAWLRELAPAAHVHRAGAARRPPPVPDVVVSADPAQAARAQALGARFLPVAPWKRLDSDAVRRDPLGHWEALPPPVRAHYARRVSILGPESTGKTTLAGALAAHYATVWVPEYLRAWLDHKGMPVVPDDVHAAARGQQALEAALARRCHRLLVRDTDLWMNVVYAEHFYGAAPPWIVAAARAQRRDATFVLEPDVPHVPDPQRDGPHLRAPILRRLLDTLAREGVAFHRVGGSWPERLARATALLDPLLAS